MALPTDGRRSLNVDLVCVAFGVPRCLIDGSHPNDWVMRAAQQWSADQADEPAARHD